MIRRIGHHHRRSPSHQTAKTAPRTSRVSLLVAVVLAAGALSGCAAGQITQTAHAAPNAVGAHVIVDEAGHIKIVGALIPPPDGGTYPQGGSAPLHLWISNTGQNRADTLTRISTDAGTVAMPDQITIPPRSIVQIGGPGADYAITITDLSHDLKYGFPVSATLNFTQAGTVTLDVPLKIHDHRIKTPRPHANIYPEPPPNVFEQH